MNVFVNGTFDVLHPGHLDLLNYAKSLGDFLLVAIDSDSRVASKKGLDRPFNPQYNRKTLLENLCAVDAVEIFNSDEELTHLVKTFSPDIMIVGSDYQNKTVIGSEHARELRFYTRSTPHSSTQIIEHFVNRRHLC